MNACDITPTGNRPWIRALAGISVGGLINGGGGLLRAGMGALDDIGRALGKGLDDLIGPGARPELVPELVNPGALGDLLDDLGQGASKGLDDILQGIGKGAQGSGLSDLGGDDIFKPYLEISQSGSDVIAETYSGTGNITSSHTLTVDEALEAGEDFVGPGYTQIGLPDSGVFRSADGLRQFRMDNGSIQGRHSPHVPHVHFEILAPGGRSSSVNNHVPIVP
jgi:hypothetical protein